MRDNIAGGALTETTLLVLLAVSRPRHGYGIMQFIGEKTGGRVALGAGTLYGALNTLTEKGWIAPCGEGARDRKKEYRVTETGRQKIEEEIWRMRSVLHLAEELVRDGDKDA